MLGINRVNGCHRSSANDNFPSTKLSVSCETLRNKESLKTLLQGCPITHMPRNEREISPPTALTGRREGNDLSEMRSLYMNKVFLKSAEQNNTICAKIFRISYIFSVANDDSVIRCKFQTQFYGNVASSQLGI